MIEIGRVCMKMKGHDAGRCVVIDLEKDRALVTGPKSLTGVRRRKVNLTHLHPLGEKLDIKKGASDNDVATAMGIKLPAARTKAEKKAEVKAEKKGFSLFKRKEKPEAKKAEVKAEHKAEKKAAKPKSAKPKPAKKAGAKKSAKKASKSAKKAKTK